jgi:hypothetical protein
MLHLLDYALVLLTVGILLDAVYTGVRVVSAASRPRRSAPPSP